MLLAADGRGAAAMGTPAGGARRAAAAAAAHGTLEAGALRLGNARAQWAAAPAAALARRRRFFCPPASRPGVFHLRRLRRASSPCSSSSVCVSPDSCSASWPSSCSSALRFRRRVLRRVAADPCAASSSSSIRRLRRLRLRRLRHLPRRRACREHCSASSGELPRARQTIRPQLHGFGVVSRHRSGFLVLASCELLGAERSRRLRKVREPCRPA